jgi:NAD(P)-dependent dehydrogenase (short-subunit alcohol dehydrogenase family)
MTTTLITGADKGLGFETACRLIAAAHTVYIGCSDTERGLAAAELMRTLFETNVFGTVRVTHAFLPLLQRSPAPVIVNLSSGLASISRTTAPAPRPTCIPVSHTRRPKRPSTWSRPSTQKLSPPCASTPLNPATRPPI